MSSLMIYNGIQVLTPEPSAVGGKAINDNFKALSTSLQAADPSPSDDSSEYFVEGSRWFNTDTRAEWICTDPTVGSAQWELCALWASDGSDIQYETGAVIVGTTSDGLKLFVPDAAGFSAPEIDFFSGGIRKAVMGYDGNAARSTFYGDAAGVGVYIDDTGYVAIGTGVSDATANPFKVFSDNTTVIGGQSNVVQLTVQAAASQSGDLQQWKNHSATVLARVNAAGQIAAPSFIAVGASAAPSSPVAGQIYFNSSSGHFFGWDGSTWKQLDD